MNDDADDPRRVRCLMSDQDDLATADTSMLTDADWTVVHPQVKTKLWRKSPETSLAPKKAA